MARRVLVQLSYAIGVAQPLSIYVDTYGTGKKSDVEIVEIIKNNWDLRPGVMGQTSFYIYTVLALISPSYSSRVELATSSVPPDCMLRSFRCVFTLSGTSVLLKFLVLGNPNFSWEKPKQLTL